MTKYFIILILIVLAWCPWLKPEEVMQIIDARVAEMQAANKRLQAQAPKPPAKPAAK